MYFLFAIVALFVIVKITRKVVRATKALATSSKEAVRSAKYTVIGGLGGLKAKAEEKGSDFTVKLANSATARINSINTDEVADRIDKAKAKAEAATTEAKAATAKATTEAKAVIRSLRARASAAIKPEPPEVEQF